MARTQLQPSKNGLPLSGDLITLSHQSLQKIGVKPPVESYNPSEENPLCKSGRELATALQPVVPGMARTIAHQTAEVERLELIANAARQAAVEELLGSIKRQMAQVELIHLRQPEYLNQLSALHQERAPRRLAFAQAAALLGIALSPDSVTSEKIAAAFRREPNHTPRPIPVPGKPGMITRYGQMLTKILAPFFCGIPISLAIGTLSGLVSLTSLQSLDSLETSVLIALLLCWLIGASLHHLLMGAGTEVGKLHAKAKYQGYVTDLPQGARMHSATWGRIAILAVLWLLTSVLEGVGLQQMAAQFAFTNTEDAPPLVVFLVIGGAINGAILTFASYLSFTNGCRELGESWSAKVEEAPRPDLTEQEIAERKALMAAACDLMDLNAQIAKIEGKLRADESILAEQPRISSEALQRITDAESQVNREALRLRELLEYITRRMGILPPLLDMGEVEVPTKMVLLPFQKIWLHLRGARHDRWPGS